MSDEQCRQELRSIAQAIDGQIVSRDLQLVEQSDFVVFFIPVDQNHPKRKPIISAGSQTELLHAYRLGKPVYGICEQDILGLSPFVTEFSDVFKTPDEALEALSKKYLGKK